LSADGESVAGDLPSFGRYESVSLLSTGGMGDVYLARLQGPGSFQKMVAIKALHAELATRPTMVQMFHDEAVLASRMNHSNVCEVFEFVRDSDQYFLVMEWLRGVSMHAYVRQVERDRFLSDLRLSATIVRQACFGLDYAHNLTDENGVSLDLIHRDVSPGNLMVDHLGRVKVLDFGVAKSRVASTQTMTGVLKGKYAYMSPEQVNQPECIDRRSDVFALGIVLWEAVAGRPLFQRDNDFQTLKAVAEGDVLPIEEVRPEIPSALSSTLMRALACDRETRFSSAAEFGDALEAALDDTVGPPLKAREIAEELQGRFPDILGEQRALEKRARGVSEVPPLLAPETSTRSTDRSRGASGGFLVRDSAPTLALARPVDDEETTVEVNDEETTAEVDDESTTVKVKPGARPAERFEDAVLIEQYPARDQGSDAGVLLRVVRAGSTLETFPESPLSVRPDGAATDLLDGAAERGIATADVVATTPVARPREQCAPIEAFVATPVLSSGSATGSSIRTLRIATTRLWRPLFFAAVAIVTAMTALSLAQ